jgi:cytochrome P450 family 135
MRALAFLQEMRERHGDLFTLRLVGGQSLLVVADPELVKQVFSAPPDVLHAGEGNDRVLGPLFGEHSLILLDEDRHMSHRRLLLPALHGPRLERQAGAIRAQVEAVLETWPAGEEIAALPWMRALTLEVVIRTSFGDVGEERLASLRAALGALRLPLSARDGARPEFRNAVAHAEAVVGEEVARRRSESLPTGDDLLSLLLEARHEDDSPLSEAEIRDELITLAMAGAETTAGSLAWALERLARAPKALAGVVAEAPDGGGPYTDATIYETLRMRPVVPMSARLVKRPFELDGRSIELGTVIAPSALLIHHRADIYPEPMEFRPERFLDQPPGTYTWIPFGGGIRRCIGASFALLEMRIVLSALLSRLTPYAADSRPEEMRSRANTMLPARGGRIVLENRRVPVEPVVAEGSR